MKTTAWSILGGLVLVLTLAATVSPIPLQIQNAGSSLGAVSTLNCSTNMTCSVSAGVASIASSGGGGGYATVQDEGVALTQRPALNFTGAGVSCVDNAGATRTDCTITGSASGSSPGGVANSIQWNDGAGGFAGNGDLKFDTIAEHFDLVASSTSYIQFNVQNTSNSTTASGDIVATSDIGNDSSFYIDMGINSSQYANPAYGSSGPNDGYLYASDSNLVIGTAGSSTLIKFHAGGISATSVVMTVSSTAVNVTSTAQLQLDGIPMRLKLVTADITSTTTTVVNITGLSWPLKANKEYGFNCNICTNTTTTSNGPRFGLNGPASPTAVVIRWRRATSATADTISTDSTFSNAAMTAAVTSGGFASSTCTYAAGAILNGANAGTAQFTLAGSSSTAGAVVKALRGSSCSIY